MATQVLRSIHFGMGELGEKRLRLYEKAAAKRGISLGAFIIKVMDRECGVSFPKLDRRRRKR
jgi:hypothetical protein